MAEMKEKKIFRVNEKTRTVRAYNEDLISEEDFANVKRYDNLGYKVILIPKKPTAHKHIKKDMIKYLDKGVIDEKIYNDFIDGVQKKKDFLTLQWQMLKAIEKKENKKNLKLGYIYELVNQAKAKENNLIEKIKKQAELENKIEQEKKAKEEQRNLDKLKEELNKNKDNPNDDK